MSDYYQHERFIKAYFSKGNIKHEGESVKVINYTPNFKDKYSVFNLSNGVTVSMKSNLSPHEDIGNDWEESKFSGAKKDIGKTDNRLERYEIALQIMVDLIATMIIFIQDSKDKIGSDEVDSIMVHINKIFDELKDEDILYEQV